jgi:Arc/MetJ family transcription regulator
MCHRGPAFVTRSMTAEADALLCDRGASREWSAGRGSDRASPPIPTSSTIYRVAVSKVSLSIDEEVLAEARARAGRRELSSYVNDALRRQLQRDRLAELLAEMDAESGPIPDELMEQARQPWRRPAAKRRRSA